MVLQVERQIMEEEISNPTFEVLLHVTLKGHQTSSFLGTFIGIPFLLIRKRFSFYRLGKFTTVFSLVGSVATFALGAGKLYNEPYIAIYDRAYRLRHNRNQVAMDDSTKLYGGLGSLAGIASLLQGFSAKRLLLSCYGGFACGSAIGLIIWGISEFNIKRNEKRNTPKTRLQSGD